MNDPYDEFHVAHPLYLKGVAQERQRILNLLRNDLQAFATVFEKQEQDFDRGIRVALERSIQKISE